MNSTDPNYDARGYRRIPLREQLKDLVGGVMFLAYLAILAVVGLAVVMWAFRVVFG